MIKKIFSRKISRSPQKSSGQVQTVFIVTYGRSGSTLLQRLLNSIDGYCIRGENNDTITGLYYSYKNAVFSKSNWGRTPTPESHPWYGADLIDPKSFGRRLAEVFLSEIVRHGTTARVVGFKEIRYFYHADIFDELMDFLLDCFPGSRIIFNKRSHLEVSKSAWWAQEDPDEVRSQLGKNDLLMAEYTKKRPESCYIADYNKYSKDVNSLRELFNFLGEPFDENRLNAILSIRLNATPRKGV